jgi:hypothetical protein
MIGNLLDNRYQITEELAQGGFGKKTIVAKIPSDRESLIVW